MKKREKTPASFLIFSNKPMHPMNHLLLTFFLLSTRLQAQPNYVPSAFTAIANTGAVLGFWVDEQFERHDEQRGFNHFQGIQRLHESNYLLLTSNTHKKGALLHVVKLASRSERGAFGSNLTAEHKPPREDRVVLNFVIEENYIHAGGIQIVDGILAVPLENSEHSKILFFDVHNPERPVKLQTEIIRKNRVTGAVAFYKTNATPDFFVLAVAGEDLEIYASTNANLNATSFVSKYRWRAGELRTESNVNARLGSYQNLNFIANFDGQIYLAGMHNNTRRLWRAFSTDYADLFRFEMNEPAKVFLTKLASKSFACQEGFLGERSCNFDAGAGVCMDEHAGMIIYAVVHAPKNGIVKFMEYSGTSFQN